MVFAPRTTNHCSIDNGKGDLEHGNAAKLGVLNFYERIKELHTKCCTARQNRLGLSLQFMPFPFEFKLIFCKTRSFA